MGFSLLPSNIGNRMAIISGPGGLAVSAAEACGMEGLTLAELSDDTKVSLSRFVPPTGTSLKNPVDVGLTASLDIEIYIKTAKAVASDPNVDTVMMVGIGLTPEANVHYTESIIQIRDELQKPFIMVNISGFDSQLSRKFCENSIPFFESTERAMHAYAQIWRYQCWRDERI